MSNVLPNSQAEVSSDSRTQVEEDQQNQTIGLENLTGLLDILVQIDLDIKRNKTIEKNIKKPYNKFVKE